MNSVLLFLKKVLFAGMIVVILGVITLKLGSHVPRPQISKPAHPSYKEILPKLKMIKNDFKLNAKTSLISQAQASESYDNAAAYVVVDLDTGDILAEKNRTKELPIASLTKLMTSVVALDLASVSDRFEISQDAASVTPTRMGIIPGQTMTLSELLNGTLLTSANDAAEAIREGIDAKYNQNIFIRAMNDKGKYLGLFRSHFANPQGYDSENNYSSVEDLAVLSAYALKNYPVIAGIVKKDYQFFPSDENHKQFDLYNWNGLIDVYPNIIGFKIGNTGDAGFTTIVASERQGKRILVVLLGAPGVLERDLWAADLLDLGYSHTSNLEAINVTAEMLMAKYSTWKYWN